MKKKVKFPHNYRRITAFTRHSLGEGAVLGLLVFFLTTLLIYRPSELNEASLAVLLSPNDLSNHLLLSQEYLKAGNMANVERELTLAAGLTNSAKRSDSPFSPVSPNSPKVLGAALSPLKILEKIRAEPQKINNEISFWEKVVASKPDYRDAYLQLALLNAQIYNNNKAKASLERAKEIDPNFEATKELEKLLKTF